MRQALVLSIVLCSSCSRAAPVEDPAERPIPPPERAALLSLFEATGGDRWKRRDWWQSPAGTECRWHGVRCTSKDGRPRVTALHLDENNLSGQLPDALAMLSSLEELSLFGNHLTGTLPAAVMRKFDDGELFLTGYTGQLSTVTEIRFVRRLPEFICSEFQARIRADGTVEVAHERCGPSTGERAPDISWDRRGGPISRYDVDRLARLSERIQFDRLLPEYSRLVTHGEFVNITIVYRDGKQRSVIDYAQAAPSGLWLLKRAVSGVAIDAHLFIGIPGSDKGPIFVR